MRTQTSSEGQVSGFGSQPFGEAGTGYAADSDPTHFGLLDTDPASGLSHSASRDYSPGLGKWTSPDPYVGSYDLADPQSFNRYAYVRNNPLGAVDPSGFEEYVPTGGTADGGSDGGALPTASCSGPFCYLRHLINVAGGVVSSLLGGLSDGGAGDASSSNPFFGLGPLVPQRATGGQTVGGYQNPAQQTYGRQLDGSYKADPAKIQAALDGKKSLGESDQCASLCKFLSGAPGTGAWTAGKHAADLTDADIGTAIATFDSTGHYPSDTDPLGKNSAIFMGRGAQGSIFTVEQWPADHGRSVAVPPFKRAILNYSPDNNVHPSRSDNADAYYVIRVP